MPLIQENISLQNYNTFGIDAKAKYFAEINNLGDLEQLLAWPLLQQTELLVLGGGSNVLFTKDYNGLVIKVSIGGLSQQAEGDHVVVSAGAGVVWNDFVQYCVKSGLAGVENLSLIPGTVGASPVQNIGAYGVELKDVFLACTAYEINTGMKRTFNFEDCAFGYRDSVFKNELSGKYIITEVQFNLHKEARVNTSYGAIQAELEKRGISAPGIADVAEVVSQIRVSKLPDPSTIGNAGSFFKNPVVSETKLNEIKNVYPEVVHYPVANSQFKLAAGWLIEQCGFKGMVSGHTGTWKNQALVLVNHGGATGQEVYSFSELIIKEVCQKFSVTLEREVNIL